MNPTPPTGWTAPMTPREAARTMGIPEGIHEKLMKSPAGVFVNELQDHLRIGDFEAARSARIKLFRWALSTIGRGSFDDVVEPALVAIWAWSQEIPLGEAQKQVRT